MSLPGITFGQWLKAQRENQDLTQADLAVQANCPPAAVSQIESGRRPPSKQSAELLATYFRIPPAEQATFVRWARGVPAAPPPPSLVPARGPFLAEAARAPAPASATTNLPARLLTPLVGRASEHAAVTDLLCRDGTCLVTLHGPAGVGKTRLALAGAGALRDHFPDGVWWVPLAAIRDPALVPGAIAGVLGVPEGQGQPLAAQLQTYLHDKDLLLLLDNCEQVLAAAPGIGDLLRAAPRLKVLTTSREVLRLEGEQVYPVPPLAPPAAQELFMARARQVDPGLARTPDTQAAIAAICARLDGLPLALELAAARSALFPPAALLARLEHRLGLLTGGRVDSPPRQRSLQAALDWSYALLAPGEQQWFRRLAVFAGGWTLAAAERVGADSSPLALVDGLAGLLDKSLIYRGGDTREPRYLMLETIREYAGEQLTASGEGRAVQQAHAEYFLALAEQAAAELRGPQQKQWLDRLETEHPNLRAALVWATDQDAATAARLAGALWPFWVARGYWSEGRRWMEQALALPLESPAQRAGLLQGAGTLARLLGDPTPARSWLEESRALYRQVGDQRGEAACVYELADLARAADAREEALRLGAQSLALYRATADPAGIAKGLLFCVNEDDETAAAHYQEALDLARACNYLPGVAMALHRLGGLAEGEDDLAHATALHEESLALFRELNDPRRVALVTEVLGEIAAAAGDLPRARERFTEALPLWQRVGERAGLLSLYYNFAGLEQASAQWGPMAAYAAQGLTAARAAGNVAGIRDGLLLLGHAQLHLGQYAPARAAYGEAVDYVTAQTSGRKLAALLVGLGTLAVRTGGLVEAAQLLGAAEAHAPLSGHDQADYDAAVAAVRAGLPDEALATAWATGRAWRVEDIRAAL